MAVTYRSTQLLGNGFILTSLLWGGAFAALIDHRTVRSAIFLFVAAAATLCGIIHSPLPSGAMFLPWNIPDGMSVHIASGYAAMAVLFLLLGRGSGMPEEE